MSDKIFYLVHIGGVSFTNLKDPYIDICPIKTISKSKEYHRSDYYLRLSYCYKNVYAFEFKSAEIIMPPQKVSGYKFYYIKVSELTEKELNQFPYYFPSNISAEDTYFVNLNCFYNYILSSDEKHNINDILYLLRDYIVEDGLNDR